MEDTHKSKPEPEAAFKAAFASDRRIFGLTEADAQIMAADLIGRPLTDEEMRRVKKDLNAGLEGWQEIMATAITEAKEA